MQRLLLPCLCLALLALAPAECASDPLSDLDSLILDNQRKLNRDEGQIRQGGQRMDSGRNHAVQERPAKPDRPGQRRQAGTQRSQRPLVAPGSPRRDPAFQIPPARRPELRAGPSGGVREYGPYYARFTVWIPPGWTAVPVEGGVRAASPDGATAAGVVIRHAGGRGAEDLARRAARQAGLDQVARQGRNTWVASGVRQGVLVRVIVHESAGRAVFVTCAGRDLATVRKMVQSLKDSRKEF